MDRLDFSSVTSIIVRYLKESKKLDQYSFIELLFIDYVKDENNRAYNIDPGLVCKWMKGRSNISPKILRYYTEKPGGQERLAENIRENFIQYLSDEMMMVRELTELLKNDASISGSEKRKLGKIKRKEDTAVFVARLLLFAMERHFIKRDAKTGKAIDDKHMSPMVIERIFTEAPPKPCPHFCGREEELKTLSELLQSESKVFLSGIAGIGKSEVVKAYADEHAADYTNILYMTYTGNLRDDIIRLDFVDDFPGEDSKDRFTRHEQFLRSLKEDSLLIIDNFDTTPGKEKLFASIMRYRCRILFTTRSRFDGQPVVELKEIMDKNVLLSLFEKFFEDTPEYKKTIQAIIDLVHSHTFTVELAARLLQIGILSPEELLKKLTEENVRLQSTDNIRMNKDGEPRQDTYYGHIHTLFSLYQLGTEETDVMRYMTFVPLTGIHAPTFAHLIGHEDMNVINGLVETGFVQGRPHRIIALHPIINEIAVADTEPDTENCRPFLDHLYEMFHHREEEFEQFPQLIKMLDGILKVIKATDKRFFLSFIESAFLYTRDYRWFDGMRRIIMRIEKLIKDKTVSNDMDKAILTTFKAYMELMDGNNINSLNIVRKLSRQLEKLSNMEPLILGSIYSEIAWLYAILPDENDCIQAEEYAKKAKEIFDAQDSEDVYERIHLESTRAMVLGRKKMLEESTALTDYWKDRVRDAYSEESKLYAMLEEAAGMALIYNNKSGLAEHNLQHAREIYQVIFNADATLIDRKDQEIQVMFVFGGSPIHREYIRNKLMNGLEKKDK